MAKSNPASSVWARLRKNFGYGPDDSKKGPKGQTDNPVYDIEGNLRGNLSPGGREYSKIQPVDQFDVFAPNIPETISYVGVSSSNVHSYAYVPNLITEDYDTFTEADNGNLYVTFRAETNKSAPGKTYLYKNFPESEYESLLVAGSKGRWIWENIRRRLYPDGSGTYEVVDRSSPVYQDVEYKPGYWRSRPIVDPMRGRPVDNLDWLFPDN